MCRAQKSKGCIVQGKGVLHRYTPCTLDLPSCYLDTSKTSAQTESVLPGKEPTRSYLLIYLFVVNA